MFDIFIWKCCCGFIELWEEAVDESGNVFYHVFKECPKCKVMMNRLKSLREYLSEENK